MKPVQQVFALVLEKIWEMNKKIPILRKYKKTVDTMRREYSDDSDKFQEKIEALRCKEIKALLFDEYLRETNNERSGIMSIDKCFSKS